MITASGVLFDIDGTLVQSLAAVERAWATFGKRHGLEPQEVLHRIHGRRSIDSIRLILPDADADAEDLVLRHLEASDTEGVVATGGALDLIECLVDIPWGVVSSGTSDVATARLAAAGITNFRATVFGEDVAQGKPHPEPFLLGAQRLGLSPAECVAFEDAPAGIRSAKDAGMRVIAIGPASGDYGADLSVEDFSLLSCETQGGKVTIGIR